MRKWNVVFVCAIAGLVLAELYMIFTALGPNLKGHDIPLGAQLKRMLVLAIFFGPFGLAVGTGVGMLLQGALKLRKKREE